MYTDRLLPHDIEAEESLIGSILIDAESITKISHFLKTEDIYSEKNKMVLSSMYIAFRKNGRH